MPITPCLYFAALPLHIQSRLELWNITGRENTGDETGVGSVEMTFEEAVGNMTQRAPVQGCMNSGV